MAGSLRKDLWHTLGRIGSVSLNIIQRAQRLKVVALVGEKPAVANIAISEHVQLLYWLNRMEDFVF